MKAGANYEVKNVSLRSVTMSLTFSVVDAANINIRVQVSGKLKSIAATESAGKRLATADTRSGEAVLEFRAVNGDVYNLSFQT
jgi:hypothetical protein